MPKLRFALASLTVLSLALFALAQEKERSRKHYGRGVTINTDDEALNCNDALNLYSDRYTDTQRAEETRNFPNQPMKITASRNGGIHLRTGTRSDISVTVCKAAAASSDATAKSMLEKIHLNASGNSLTIEGPTNTGWDDDASWSALVIVEAPAGATFDLSAHNGGISARQFTGNLTAETVNGGIALVRSNGKMNVEARNGGISIKDCGGDVKANVQNGGLHIELAETWNGQGLDANTRNGGLVVAVPKTMQSGVEVAMKGHGGVVCQSDVCSSGQRTWDDDGRTIRFGSGNVLVRASTVNGGLVIQERGRNRARL